MTRKELMGIAQQFAHVKTGYCCYQDDGISKYDMIELGYNRGVYGWNWTAYAYLPTNTLYISSYRNVPANIEK